MPEVLKAQGYKVSDAQVKMWHRRQSLPSWAVLALMDEADARGLAYSGRDFRFRLPAQAATTQAVTTSDA